MAISGLIGSGAQDALQELFAKRLLQEKFAEQKQQQQFENTMQLSEADERR